MKLSPGDVEKDLCTKEDIDEMIEKLEKSLA